LEQAEHWACENEWERARQLFLAAMALDPGLKCRWEYARFLGEIGEDAAAIEQLTALWNEAKRRNDASWIIAACESLAVIYRNRGQAAIAWSYQQQAISARVRWQSSIAAVDVPTSEFLGVANAAILQGDLDHAGQLAKIAMDCSEQQKGECHIADAWGTRGVIFLLQKQLAPAWRCFLNAYGFHCRANDEEGRTADLLNLAAVCREWGRWELARRLLAKACKVARTRRNSSLLPKAELFREEAERILAVADRVPEWN
jgi:hypothetical protein